MENNEFNEQIKELYGEDHEFTEVEFRGDYSIGDFIVPRRSPKGSEIPKYPYSGSWSGWGICSETYVSDKEVEGTIYRIDEIESIVGEDGVCRTTYFVGGYRNGKSLCGNWFRGLKEEYMEIAEGYEAHPWSRKFLAPYKIGTEVWVKTNGNLYGHFCPKKQRIRNYKTGGRGYTTIDGTIRPFCQSLVFGEEVYEEHGYKYHGWSNNFIGSYLNSRDKFEPTRNCFSIEELKEEIQPSDFHHFCPSKWSSIFDKRRLGWLIKDLGYTEEEFEEIAFKEPKTEKKPKKSVKKPTKKKESKKSEVKAMFEGLTEAQKKEMLKLLSKK